IPSARRPIPSSAPLVPPRVRPAVAVTELGEVLFSATAKAGGFRDTVVLDRMRLLRANVIEGPAIIEEHDARTLIHPGWTATVDEHAQPRAAALTIEQDAVSNAIRSRSACSITSPAL